MRALSQSAQHYARSSDGSLSQPLAEGLAQKWEELHSVAAELATMADLAPETFDERLAAFPMMLDEASEWQRQMAGQGIEDIDAMMRPGLTAIATITQRGADFQAPAMTLWREFHHAREAVLALVQPASGIATYA